MNRALNCLSKIDICFFKKKKNFQHNSWGIYKYLRILTYFSLLLFIYNMYSITFYLCEKKGFENSIQGFFYELFIQKIKYIEITQKTNCC